MTLSTSQGNSETKATLFATACLHHIPRPTSPASPHTPRKPSPASSASACLRFQQPPTGLQPKLSILRLSSHIKASIIGVSLFAFSNILKTRPASSASAQHHHVRLSTPKTKASIISISRSTVSNNAKSKVASISISTCCCPTPKPRQAASATGSVLADLSEARQHHAASGSACLLVKTSKPKPSTITSAISGATSSHMPTLRPA